MNSPEKINRRSAGFLFGMAALEVLLGLEPKNASAQERLPEKIPSINDNPQPVEELDESKIYPNINLARFLEILKTNPNSIIFDGRFPESAPGAIATEQSDFQLVNNNRIVRYFLGEPIKKDDFDLPTSYFHITQSNAQPLSDQEFISKIIQRSGGPAITFHSEIVVVCHSGIRSKQVAAKLVSLGFKNIKMLWGGFSAIRQQGTPELKKLIFRQ